MCYSYAPSTGRLSCFVCRPQGAAYTSYRTSTFKDKGTRDRTGIWKTHCEEMWFLLTSLTMLGYAHSAWHPVISASPGGQSGAYHYTRQQSLDGNHWGFLNFWLQERGVEETQTSVHERTKSLLVSGMFSTVSALIEQFPSLSLQKKTVTF